MLKVPWIVIVDVLINVFGPACPSHFPSFFDSDDLKELGVKTHKSHYVPATVTGRYPSIDDGTIVSSMEQFHQKIPPNGLPIHYLPKTMMNREPYKPVGRSGLTGLKVLEQVEDEYGEKVFPKSDGRQFTPEDNIELMDLPKRLTALNKWDEFKSLIAEEGAQQHGKVMKNWEEDAHRWALYAKHLVERGKREHQRKIARENPPKAPAPVQEYTPSLGHDFYWGNIPKPTPKPVARQLVKPRPQNPWGHSLPFAWRRQMSGSYMNGNQDYMDNIQGPLRNGEKLPPIYYKQGSEEGFDNPREPPENENRALRSLAELDYGDVMKDGNMARFLPAYPKNNFALGPEGDPAERFSGLGSGPYSSQLSGNPEMGYGSPGKTPAILRGGNPINYGQAPQPNAGQYSQSKSAAFREGGGYPPSDYPDSREKITDVDTYTLQRGGGGSGPKIQPGPGSEGDFPDGYKPNIAGGDMGLSIGQMGGDLVSGENSPKRQGGEYQSFDYTAHKSPLRMGGEMSAPGPGSESDFPEGYHPGMPAGNMGLPPGSRDLGPLPGRGGGGGGGPPPGMHEGPSPSGYSPGSGGMRGPGGMQGPGGGMPGMGGMPDMGGMPGMGGMQDPGGMPGMGKMPGMGGMSGMAGMQGPGGPMGMGGMQGPGGPMGMGGMQGPGGPMGMGGMKGPGGMPGMGGMPNQMMPHSRLPTGYALMTIAKKKIAASDRVDNLVEASTRGVMGTTTPRPPTKQEILSSLRQLDDFHAPIRWVKFNSEDTRDGLARVTDRKTHRNQQIFIEGELYVPVIDESMLRLGWTTEDPNAATSNAPTALPNDSAIKVVVRTMNLNGTDEQEWLAIETVLGAKKPHGPQCNGVSCQARCHKTGCDSACKGDTCASGCVGVSCNAICKGPGCFSMCIGDQCTAKCEGLNCETRCWGKSCEADCHSMSCQHTVNGMLFASNTTWDQMYPQYEAQGNPDVYSKQDARMGNPTGYGGGPSENEDYYSE